MRETILHCDLCGNIIHGGNCNAHLLLECPNKVNSMVNGPGPVLLCNLEVEITVTGLALDVGPNEGETLDLDICSTCTREYTLKALAHLEDQETEQARKLSEV